MMFAIRPAKLPSPTWMQASLKLMARSKTLLRKQLQTCELNLLKTVSKATNSSLDRKLNWKMVRYVNFSFYICIQVIHIVIIEDEGKAVLQPAHPSNLFINLQTYSGCRQGAPKFPPNRPSHHGSGSRMRCCELFTILYTFKSITKT